MKILIVGTTGTMGKHLAQAFESEHEVIKAAGKGTDITVDITSTGSIENMFKQVVIYPSTIPGISAMGDNASRTRTLANAIAMGTTAGMMLNKELVLERF